MSALSGIGGRLYRGETSIDFIGKRRRWYAISAVFLIAAVVALSTSGLKLGIEFKGGSSFLINKAGATVAQANDALKAAGITTESVVQKVGTSKISIQTGTLTQDHIVSLKQDFVKAFNVDISQISSQVVGPSWGKEISSKALRALIVFLIVVMIYLALAFEPKMAIAAIIAVIHDVLITVGIYALVGFEVTPATVIGFLTILGYSLYYTVVVFDKIRENTRSITSTGKMTYSQAANLGVNQTLVRSFNTSLIALLPVASILFVGAGLLGAGTLKDLSLALFIGLATGTYSSIFIATPILAALREREPAMKALTKRIGQRTASTGEAKVGAQVSEGAPLSEKIKRGPRNQPKRKHR